MLLLVYRHLTGRRALASSSGAVLPARSGDRHATCAWPISVVLCAVLLAAPAGCSAGTRDAAPEGNRTSTSVTQPRRIVACDLVLTGDVETILGGPIDPLAGTDNEGADELAGRSGCAITRADGTVAVLIELVRTDDMAVSVRRTGFSAQARFFAAISRVEREPEPIGDDTDALSLWVDEEATMYVLDGRSYLVVEVASPPDQARPMADALVVMARRELARRAD